MNVLGPPQQQHVRTEGVAPGQDRQVLQHDGVKQRGHQLVGRDALLLQAVDVDFGEDTALAGDRVESDAGVSLVAELVGGQLQLGVDLVDDRAGPAGALVIHGRDLFLAAALVVILENDDLGILPTEFDHRVHFGVKRIDR